MKSALAVFICLLFAVSSIAFEVPDPEITGFWLTQKQDAIVEIFYRDDLYHGKIIWLEEPLEDTGIPKKDENNPELSKRDDLIIGLEILKDFKQKKKSKWAGGSIYDPDNGKTYSCVIKKKDANLNIRGFIGISLLGRTEVWTRASIPDSTISEPVKE